MKNRTIFYLFVLMLISCKEHQKQNVVEQTNSTLQLYNDILIDYVENFGYWRYLGDKGIDATFEITDSIQRIKRKLYFHNQVFKNGELQETVFLIDTLTKHDFRGSHVFVGSSSLESICKSMNVNPQIVSDSIKQSSVKFKASEFKSFTFKVKSISEFKVKENYTGIGIISFSKVFLNSRKDEGILYCSFYCGGLCGKGTILKIKKNKNHWKIISHQTTWIS